VSSSLSWFQNVQPKAGTPGVEQPSAPQGGGGGGNAQSPPPGGMFTMLLPFLIMVPFLFLMFRRQKKEQEARGKLKRGDRIASNSGLVGELVDLDERFAKVKLAPGITVTMLASSVAPLEADKSAEKKDAKADDKDLKDAKVAAEKK
jgi:preprotein translocase subunit YajC